MRRFPVFLTVSLLLSSGPAASEQHSNMMLVRGEPIITITNPDHTIRPRPGHGDGFVSQELSLSDGSGAR